MLKCPKWIVVLFSSYGKKWQAFSDHQQQTKSSNTQYFLYILYSGASLFLTWEKKNKSEDVDKTQRGETEREKEGEDRLHSETLWVLPLLLPTAGGYLPRDLRGWDTICCSTLAGNSSAAAEELELSWGWVCRRSLQSSGNVVPNLLVVPQIALKVSRGPVLMWMVFWQRRDVEESKEMNRKEAVVVKRQEGEWVSLGRWVQLVMGFISLGLPCFTVQTVSVKARLKLNGECCSFSLSSGRPTRSDFSILLSVLIVWLLLKKMERKPKTIACTHTGDFKWQLMFRLWGCLIDCLLTV